MLACWKKSCDQSRQHIKKLTKVHLVKTMVFPVVTYACESLDHKESWALKTWCFWTVVLERTLESPLDCKEIKLVNPKGNQSWIFTGRTDAETEAPVLWPPDVKNWLNGKDPDAGKDWRQEEKGMTEDEMVGWHHWRDGHEFEQALGVGDGQRGPACYSPWGRKETWLNIWTELCIIYMCIHSYIYTQHIFITEYMYIYIHIYIHTLMRA